jgi:nicotinate-nucleotide adenylyltransferase
MFDYVALYGGGFDPFHNGHLHVIKTLQKNNLKKIILLPTGISAFNKELSASQHRINMIKLSVDNEIEICNFEVDNKKISYAIDSINHFLKKYPKIFFVMGEDNFYSLKKWKLWKDITAKVKILVVKRNTSNHSFEKFTQEQGFELTSNLSLVNNPNNKLIFYIDTPCYDISSSEIKNAIHTKDHQTLTSHLTNKVIDYVYKNKLYKLNK